MDVEGQNEMTMSMSKRV